ncbi:chemotaxis protein CheW [Selenomonas sp. TAMA-11512]|uniref:chemotaxis protein CheW n=1 Tax=Selenomonas sp. TAMA-11512 TaxID=3095337 RepID=UPI003090B234|nr:chemotaxis protein CheW [Selenomonas sp. TAMA-11512]
MASDNKMVDDIQVGAFKLLNEEYGVNILNVQEIKVMTDITRIPFAPDYVKGVMNLRGSVLPVIDLKRRLGLADAPYTDASRIIVMKIGELSVGMIVDAVTEVMTIDGRRIESAKSVSDGGAPNPFIDGIGKVNDRLIIMLNLDEIVDLPEELK